MAVLCLASGWWYATAITSHAQIGLHRGAPNDFFQFWNSGRAVLNGADPYGPQVTLQNQIGIYEEPANKIPSFVYGQRLAYPITAAFLAIPFSVLPFAIADKLAVAVFASLLIASIGWIRGRWDSMTVLYCVLALSFYPTIVALQMHQPTLLYFGLSVASLASLRSGRFALAGLLSALAASKPQLAGAFLLPMIIWSFASLKERKKYAVSLLLSGTVILAAAQIIRPNWMASWLDALIGYTSQVHVSIVMLWFGERVGAVVTIMAIIGLCAILWLYRESDLRFLAAISALTFCFLIQREQYNMVLLIMPLVWVGDHQTLVNDLAMRMWRVALAGTMFSAAVGYIIMQAGSFDVATNITSAIVFPLLLATAGCIFCHLHPAARESLVTASSRT